MSETDDSTSNGSQPDSENNEGTAPSESELEDKYSDEPEYTVSLNGQVYEVNEEWRSAVERRAELAYEGNEMFSCWWRVADASDEADDDTVHEEGDPILVIETAGPIVPWDSLDQLEMEMQDTSAYQEHDPGTGSDVDEGNGMKTIKPDKVRDDNQGSDDTEEIPRTHFGITPQSFEELPSPDGERPDRIPPKPQEFDEPKLVFWIPEDPDIEHTWSTGEAIAPMDTWDEWNLQQKANQPRPKKEKPDSHDHFESLAGMYGAEVVAKLAPKQKPDKSQSSQKPQGESSAKKENADAFENGKYGGNNWQI